VLDALIVLSEREEMEPCVVLTYDLSCSVGQKRAGSLCLQAWRLLVAVPPDLRLAYDRIGTFTRFLRWP
jgi:hypothetical protein